MEGHTYNILWVVAFASFKDCTAINSHIAIGKET